MIATGNHQYFDSLRGAPPLKEPLRRIDSQRPKMFRFLNAYSSECCRSSPCRLPKIGTFSGVGWRSGGGFLRGRIFEAPLKLTSLVTFLFSDKKVTLPREWLAITYTSLTGQGSYFHIEILQIYAHRAFFRN